jgi:hypothetical protein
MNRAFIFWRSAAAVLLYQNERTQAIFLAKNQVYEIMFKLIIESYLERKN